MIIRKPFYLMRHAQTVANKKEVACGLLDSSLTNTGIRQAKKASKAFSPYLEKVTTIYHSALIRSRNTAEYLKGSHKITMFEIPGINEHSFGDWEGLSWKFVFNNLIEGNKPPGGESRDEFALRIRNTLNFLLSNHSSDSIPLLVAHGGTFFAIAHLFEFEVINIPNCYLCYFEPKANSKASIPWLTSSFDYSTGNFVNEKIFYKNTSRDVI